MAAVPPTKTGPPRLSSARWCHLGRGAAAVRMPQGEGASHNTPETPPFWEGLGGTHTKQYVVNARRYNTVLTQHQGRSFPIMRHAAFCYKEIKESEENQMPIENVRIMLELSKSCKTIVKSFMPRTKIARRVLHAWCTGCTDHVCKKWLQGLHTLLCKACMHLCSCHPCIVPALNIYFIYGQA